MALNSRPAVISGMILGAVYILAAVIALPAELIVLLAAPFFCGLLASYLYSRQSANALQAGDGAQLGAGTGLIGGAILVLIGAPLVYLVLATFAEEELKRELGQIGIQLPYGGLLLLFAATIIEALLGLVVAVFGGVAGAALFRNRS